MTNIKIYIILIVLMFTGSIFAESRGVSFENRFNDNRELDAPFWGGNVLQIISDEAVNTTNDSLTSEWYEVTGFREVEFMILIDDTCRVDYNIDYSFGTFKSETDGFLTVAGVGTDSIVTKGSAVANKIKGVIVRGFGTSAITNLIPGANWVRIRCRRFAGAGSEASETTNTLRVGIKRTD